MLDAALAPGGSLPDAATTPSAAGGIRPCTIEDIPAVARLFRATFTDCLKAGGRPLEALLQRELFEHPWRDPNLPSPPECRGGGRIDHQVLMATMVGADSAAAYLGQRQLPALPASRRAAVRCADGAAQRFQAGRRRPTKS